MHGHLNRSVNLFMQSSEKVPKYTLFDYNPVTFVLQLAINSWLIGDRFIEVLLYYVLTLVMHTFLKRLIL